MCHQLITSNTETQCKCWYLLRVQSYQMHCSCLTIDSITLKQQYILFMSSDSSIANIYVNLHKTYLTPCKKKNLKMY